MGLCRVHEYQRGCEVKTGQAIASLAADSSGDASTTPLTYLFFDAKGNSLGEKSIDIAVGTKRGGRIAVSTPAGSVRCEVITDTEEVPRQGRRDREDRRDDLVCGLQNGQAEAHLVSPNQTLANDVSFLFFDRDDNLLQESIVPSRRGRGGKIAQTPWIREAKSCKAEFAQVIFEQSRHHRDRGESRRYTPPQQVTTCWMRDTRSEVKLTNFRSPGSPDLIVDGKIILGFYDVQGQLIERKEESVNAHVAGQQTEKLAETWTSKNAAYCDVDASYVLPAEDPRSREEPPAWVPVPRIPDLYTAECSLVKNQVIATLGNPKNGKKLFVRVEHPLVFSFFDRQDQPLSQVMIPAEEGFFQGKKVVIGGLTPPPGTARCQIHVAGGVDD